MKGFYVIYKLWSHNPKDNRQLHGFVPLPIGLQGTRCPKCESENLIGAIITETADEADPNILCKNCSYWWD